MITRICGPEQGSASASDALNHKAELEDELYATFLKMQRLQESNPTDAGSMAGVSTPALTVEEIVSQIIGNFFQKAERQDSVKPGVEKRFGTALNVSPRAKLAQYSPARGAQTASASAEYFADWT